MKSIVGRSRPKHYVESKNKYQKKFNHITDILRKRIEGEVKALLHCHRDTLRNKKVDTTKVTFDCRDGYYGEAFGIMRGLVLLGYGYFGSNNLNAFEDCHNNWDMKQKVSQDIHNVTWWFDQLEDEVLEEENYKKSGVCEYCYGRYKKDDSTWTSRLKAGVIRHE